MPPKSPHPYEYPAAEVSDTLLQHLRRPQLPGCSGAATAAATAAGGFLPAAGLAADLAEAGGGEAPALAGLCRRLEERRERHAQRHAPLGPQCRLLARKFLDHTVEAALAAVAPCDSAALVLNDGTCPGETPGQAARRRAWQRAAPWALLCAAGLLIPLLVALLMGAVGPALPRSRRASGR